MWTLRTIIFTVALTLAGCQQSADWHGKDISGLMPDLAFELINAQGETVTEADFDDRINLLFFGFTYCPDICPTTLAQLAAAVRQLPENQRGEVQILFISVDPDRDSGARLAEYANAFGEQITGLTGSQQQLEKLTRRYRVTYGYGQPDDAGNYNVSHSSAVFAFDKDGEVRLLLREDLTPAELSADLQRLYDNA